MLLSTPEREREGEGKGEIRNRDRTIIPKRFYDPRLSV